MALTDNQLLGIGAGMGLVGIGETIRTTRNQSVLLNAQQNEYLVQAQLVNQAAEFELRNLRRSQRFRIGAIVAGYGAAGVRVDTGSPVEVVMEQARVDASERLGVRIQRSIQARQLQGQAALAGFQRRILQRNTPFDAIGRGLSFASPFIAATI